MAKVSASIKKENYTTEISNQRTTLLADEPIDEGGKDKGFAPTELLAASLASCTSITLRMYANRKEWPVEEINVDVEVLRNDKQTLFTRDISLVGKLDEKQRNRILAIANACPVHKMLSQDIQIETTLK